MPNLTRDMLRSERIDWLVAKLMVERDALRILKGFLKDTRQAVLDTDNADMRVNWLNAIPGLETRISEAEKEIVDLEEELAELRKTA